VALKDAFLDKTFKRMFINYNTDISFSAAVERVFFLGKDILKPKRAGLSDKHFEMQVQAFQSVHHLNQLYVELVFKSTSISKCSSLKPAILWSVVFCCLCLYYGSVINKLFVNVT